MGRRKDSGVSISLFPFLSILAALIGALVVIIVAMAIIQLNKAEGREPEVVERAREYLDLDQQVITMQDEIQQLKLKIDTYIKNQRDQQELLEERKTLQDIAEDKKKVEEKENDLINEINRLKRENDQMDVDHEALLAKIEELKQLLAERETGPGEPAVQVIPTGSGQNRSYFVEVAADGVLLHRPNGDPVRVPNAKLRSSPEFLHLLKLVEDQAYRRLVFLIRPTPESVANYSTMQAVVADYSKTASRRIDALKLPIPGSGKVDLSVFARFMEPWEPPQPAEETASPS